MGLFGFNYKRPRLGGIGFRLKDVKMFNDRTLWMVDKTSYRFLSKVGAYTRAVARNSLKDRQGPSAPGKPPHSHAGHLEDIFYGHERGGSVLVVGPILHGARNDYGTTTVPELMEYGGVVRGKDGVFRRYEARPFMRPAFAKAQRKLDDFWAQSLMGQ